ncbi:hypothetical protein A3A60_03710 [Candidatus Curtissbacteria bacterium RIFCSPLOWO2_01_FULL_42_26]|uniref:BioF2-like acetyltransferase domain-containing protein n=1 Tax=Candidatus Curtissbacteria bacterium RIFCSPLOWO2_01_FULL_42_26 TaxID=1797729 RepID=A0A1F5HVJ3_9BACT|nr:MAG: hypothetical protein A3A60_03710 [Candidatus Curtissbacteria bacterium RIFCSPLOWO2_01_FULL_42_26]
MGDSIVREVEENEKSAYNLRVMHVVQSWEWGEFRRKTGLDLVRLGHFSGKKMLNAYQLTFHQVPVLAQTIGYFPKGPMPDAKMIEALATLGKSKNAAFIKIEPNVVIDEKTREEAHNKILSLDSRLILSKKPLFTKHNFVIDLTRTEAELMRAMHPKTRYNVGLAHRYGVQVYESTKEEDFEIYLKLYFETTKRQNYFGHTPTYHKLIWETLMPAGMARVLIAKYQGKPLAVWMLFNFANTLYYPYGGSSIENKEVMASNLLCWEAIRLGKKMGLKIFDMWGALAPDASQKDSWYGFHRFKAGYGPMQVEYIGTYDLILQQALYRSLNLADRFRWLYLKTMRR